MTPVESISPRPTIVDILSHPISTSPVTINRYNYYNYYLIGVTCRLQFPPLITQTWDLKKSLQLICVTRVHTITMSNLIYSMSRCVGLYSFCLSSGTICLFCYLICISCHQFRYFLHYIIVPLINNSSPSFRPVSIN